MAHPFSNRPSFEGLNDGLFGFGGGADLPEGAAAALASFAAKIASFSQDGDSVWAGYAKLQGGIVDTIAKGDPAEIDAIVRGLYGAPLTHGFLQGPQVTQALRADPQARVHVGSIIMDRFYRLAEAVGATTVLSAEHHQGTIRIEDPDAVFSRIEECIGIKLPAPAQDGDIFGLRLKGGYYSDRHFDGIYGAWRLRELARAQGQDSPAMLEVGGGAGHLAYFSKLMGCRHFRIVDLPYAAMVQYIVLATAFGVDAVGFDSARNEGVDLVLAGSEKATDFSGRLLVVNVDSLPEMPPEVAQGYVSCVESEQIFLSINQESRYGNGQERQNVVRELAAKAGLRRLSRHPAWLRTGYVEEVYERRA